MVDTAVNVSRRSVPLNDAGDLSLPLTGAIICCTSVPDEKRTQLATHAEQMGAVHRYDLTLDVTHLIVGDYDTPKYRYVAKERPDVRPMTTKWIEAIRELWINDHDIDLESLEREHTLPTLHSLKFSMTGCDDPSDRLEIAEQVKANGAIYEGDLTKQITHLISFRTEGAKYKAARQWGIRIVSIEWLRDTLERGMILDEKLYDPALPLEERGKGAWNRTKPKRTSLGKRSREGSTDSLEGGKRKLRRTASTKLSSQNDRIWGDIVGGGMVAQVARSGQWDVKENQAPPKNTTSKANQDQDIHKPGKFQSPTKNPDVAKGMFSGCHFYFHGFTQEKSQILCNHLLPQGAHIPNTLEELASPSQASPPSRLFMIVPHDVPISKHPALPRSQPPIETITVWWVERCLHNKKFIDPNEHVIGRPFPKFPVEGFDSMTISSSAFSGIDLLHVVRVVELLGAKYSEDMTPNSSVLVTKSLVGLRKDKFDHAQEWRVPIVSANWLWDSIVAGIQLPLQKYRCRPQKRPGSLPNASERPFAEDRPQAGGSKSEATKPQARTNSSNSRHSAKPPRNSGIDETAFADDKPTVKQEDDTQPFQPTATASDSTTQQLPHPTEPLSERSLNSPSKTGSTAPTTSDRAAPRPRQDMSNAISNLLAKTKTATAQPAQTEPEVRKRGRILGRVTSNMSTGSTSHSRATSVDSTATHGHPVEYPPYSTVNGSGQTANEQIDMLMKGGGNLGKDEDSQPPATQLQYDDPESKEAKERAMARMMGEKVESRMSGIREKAVTMGDFAADKPRTRRTGRERGGLR